MTRDARSSLLPRTTMDWPEKDEYTSLLGDLEKQEASNDHPWQHPEYIDPTLITRKHSLQLPLLRCYHFWAADPRAIPIMLFPCVLYYPFVSIQSSEFLRSEIANQESEVGLHRWSHGCNRHLARRSPGWVLQHPPRPCLYLWLCLFFVAFFSGFTDKMGSIMDLG